MNTFLKALAATPLRRKAVDFIDTETTAICVLSMNLQSAINYYAQTYSPLPKFYVLDLECCPPRLRSDATAVPVTYAEDLRGKQVCLYSPLFHTRSEGEAEYNRTALAASKLALEPLLVDKRVAENLRYWGQKRLLWSNFNKYINIFREVYDIFTDEQSKEVYTGVIRNRLSGEHGYLPIAHYPLYRHPKVPVLRGDVVCGAGAGDGSTALADAEAVGPSGKVFAFEVLPENFEQSLQATAGHENIFITELGLWSCTKEMYVTVNGSAVATTCNETATMPCSVISLDDFLTQKNERCDYLQLDIEGGEFEVLKGAINTLRAYRPRMSISVYHKPLMDFLHIPKFIYDLKLDYEFYLGHHQGIPIDTILYCNPK